MADKNDRIYLSDLSQSLTRTEHTIRQWLQREDFPKSLRPKEEGGRKKMYWTPSQLPGLKRYADQRARSRGWSGVRRRQAGSQA